MGRWDESVPVPRELRDARGRCPIAIDRYLAPGLIGQSSFDLEGINRVMSQEIAPAFATGMPITKAGIDMALHDLMGKLAGRNIAKLWGRTTREELELSWTVSTTDLDEAGRLVEEGLEQGFRHFNIKVAPDPDFDLQLVDRAVRSCRRPSSGPMRTASTTSQPHSTLPRGWSIGACRC